MITSATTFVVGAGASKSYLLPTAADLLLKARALTPNDNVYRLVSVVTGGPETLNAVLMDIRRHPAQSVDAFLESRQSLPNVVEVGKALMTSLLGFEIDSARKRPEDAPPNEDWMGYLIEKMRKGASTWTEFVQGNDGVRFVTFNFDTLIEDRMKRSLEAMYLNAVVDFAKVFEKIQVIHVHGARPFVPKDFAHDGSGGFAADSPEVQWVRSAAPNINVVLEAIDVQTRRVATEAVLGAKRVCFLGFGYDFENLDRIGFRRRFKGMSKNPGLLFGSAYDLWKGEQNIVSRYFHERIQLAPKEMKCRDALRFLDVFEE